MFDIVAPLAVVWLTSIPYFKNSSGIKTIDQGSISAGIYVEAEVVRVKHDLFIGNSALRERGYLINTI